MKARSILLKISLLAVLLLASCAPAVSPEPAQAEAPAQPPPVENEPPALPAPTATFVVINPTEVPATEAPTTVPQVVVTSRGPNLEASDPTIVKLDSGELQFVEFFRFT